MRGVCISEGERNFLTKGKVYELEEGGVGYRITNDANNRCSVYRDRFQILPDEQTPSEAAERKAKPICTGVLDYFPDALAAVAICSRVGNEQHNPGQPLHWAKEKSTDHADALLRHLVDRGTVDTDGVLHSA